MSVTGFRKVMWVAVIFTSVALAAGYAARWELDRREGTSGLDEKAARESLGSA